MVTLDSDLFKCCHRVETLGWTNDTEAKRLLQQAADQVRPIMVKRKWAVPLLTEFYPPTPNLLGLNHNHGARIEIRLRSPSHLDIFLPYESILGTLLHELAHIQVGPHNAQFYKLLDELQDECDALIAKGISGVDRNGVSVSNGNRLGGNSALPRRAAQNRAVAAAQDRKRISQLMPKGGRTLGGDAEISRIAAICDPREMAVAAAERRRHDEQICAVTVSKNVVPPHETEPLSNGVQVIDVDAHTMPVIDDKVIIVSDHDQNAASTSDKFESSVAKTQPSSPMPASTRMPRRVPPRRSTGANRIPVRESPASRAALERAQLTARRFRR